MLAPASANVVMQLSRLGVGRGVAESRVHSGSLFRHPLRRTRMTLTYIDVSLYGTEEERRELRRHVNAQHRDVRSRPGDAVAYDAYDPNLQLWVGACMYVGSLQGYETLYGAAPEDVAEELLARCARFSTTLQVPAHQWPRDRASFAMYWQESLKEVSLDEVTRNYLREFIDLRYLPRPLGAVLRPLNRLLTGGYLEPAFRDALELDWTSRRQRQFERAQAVMRWLDRYLPTWLAIFPWNLVRYDSRRRLARGRPLTGR